MCWIDSQSKKLIHLKYLILLKYLIPFPLYSVSILVLCTMKTLSPLFSGINKNNHFLFFLKDKEEI